MQTTTYVSPAKFMPEAFASSSQSIWAACDAQCPIPHRKSQRAPQKGLLDPHVPRVDGMAGDPGTQEMLPRPPLSLWARGQADAQGINCVELSNANMISWEEWG